MPGAAAFPCGVRRLEAVVIKTSAIRRQRHSRPELWQTGLDHRAQLRANGSFAQRRPTSINRLERFTV